MVAILIYFLIGFFAGTMSGLLGIGGGMVVVPALAVAFNLLHMPADSIMRMASGTALAVMIITTASSMMAHIRRKGVVWPIILKMLPYIILGVIIGAFLAARLPVNMVRIFFGIFVLLIAIKMAFDIKPKPDVKSKMPGKFVSGLVSIIIGFKSGLLGIGGGAVSVPFLSFCKSPMKQATGSSTAIGFFISITGTLSFMFFGSSIAHEPIPNAIGYVYIPAFLVIGFTTAFSAQLGAAISHRVSDTILKKIFIAFLLIVCFDMFYR